MTKNAPRVKAMQREFQTLQLELGKETSGEQGFSYELMTPTNG